MLASDLLAAGREHLALRGVGDDDIEYFSAVNPESLQEVTTITAPTLFAIAARVGGVRLIDNIIVPVRT